MDNMEKLVKKHNSNILKKDDKKKYFGISETEFKTRLSNHKKSFKNRIYETDTELSKYIWDLKDKNITNYCINGP